MKHRLLSIVSIAAICLLLLSLVEICSLYILPAELRKPFLVSINKNFEQKKSVLFSEIDPLLGWAMTAKQLAASGFKVDSGFVALKSCDTCLGNEMRIFITGGSTTDPATISHNWPVELAKILSSKGIKAKIFIGAVGGYNSGQELLKLLRDKELIRPTLHISYSGANEGEPSYVSNQEMGFFENEVNQNTSPFLPNTVAFWRHKKDNETLNLRNYRVDNSTANFADAVSAFWLKNMHCMNALAKEGGYYFYGFLQPVVGSGMYTQKSLPKYAPAMIKNYKRYYPLLAKSVAEHPTFLIDLKNIFDQTADTVYTDDCHLHPQFQHTVAQQIFEDLNKRNVWISSSTYSTITNGN